MGYIQTPVCIRSFSIRHCISYLHPVNNLINLTDMKTMTYPQSVNYLFNRKQIGVKLGLDRMQNLLERIAELTDGFGVDVVLENSGAIEPIEQSLDIVRKGGKIIVKEIDIKGEISQIPYDWLTALHLVETGRVKTDRLVTHLFPLDEWQDAFNLAATSPECLRVALQP